MISLTQSGNAAIRKSPKTLKTVNGALREYKSLTSTVKVEIDAQAVKLDSRLNSNISLVERIKGKGIKDRETKWRGKLSEMQTLWTSYSQGVSELEGQVRELERYQASLVIQEDPTSVAAPLDSFASQWLSYLAAFVGLVLGGMLIFRFRLVK